jgi:hypothetical protein
MAYPSPQKARGHPKEHLQDTSALFPGDVDAVAAVRFELMGASSPEELAARAAIILSAAVHVIERAQRPDFDVAAVTRSVAAVCGASTAEAISAAYAFTRDVVDAVTGMRPFAGAVAAFAVLSAVARECYESVDVHAVHAGLRALLRMVFTQGGVPVNAGTARVGSFAVVPRAEVGTATLCATDVASPEDAAMVRQFALMYRYKAKLSGAPCAPEVVALCESAAHVPHAYAADVCAWLPAKHPSALKRYVVGCDSDTSDDSSESEGVAPSAVYSPVHMR